MKPIPTLHFDTDRLPPADRFPAWCSALPHYRLSLPPGTRPESFATRVTAWHFEELVLTRAKLPAVHWLRAAERARTDGVNTYNFLLITRGSFAGATPHRTILIGAGQIGCFDLAQTYEGDSEPSDSLAITVARSAIDRLLRAEPDLHGHVFSDGAGLLLADHLLALERQLPSLCVEDAPPIARATLAVFAAAIEIAERRTGRRTVLDGVRHQARRQIERHLGDRDFTPERLAEQLGVTRSALYRSFAAFGGIAAYMRRRRLEAIRVLLGDIGERRSIAELAQTFGFADASHLSTAFRQAYGVTPREHRQKTGTEVGRGDTAMSPTELFRAWTGKLQGRSL